MGNQSARHRQGDAMTASGIIVAVLSGLCFAAAAVSGFLLVILGSRGAPGEILLFWLAVTLGCGVAGGLLAWAA